ncbi:MAG TPA: alpha/beta hydrolase-fold protein [Gemmatimonadales bacterium]|nr:alpha/beta hydrolase-fold protein [Gemmatimonadales bacterium]
MTAWRKLARGFGALVRWPARDRVRVERLPPFDSRLLGEVRRIDVFLPRSYDSDSFTSYPVLYANDGQDMEAVGLKEILEVLQGNAQMSPVIVVAIHATERVQDYGTAGVINAQGLGGRADRYGQFVMRELMPAIEARYRIERGATHTAIMGWSLGGLSAFDLAWRHPERFGAVGVFSGSFWWRTDDRGPAARQASRIMHRRVREVPGHPALRMWFETGLHDETADRDGDGVIDAVQDTEELVAVLEQKGYRRGEDVVHLTVDGGHDLPTWQRMLPVWLTWAFPGSASP